MPQSTKSLENSNFLFEKYSIALELFVGPSWLNQSDSDLELKNKQFLRLLDYKLDPDVLTLQAYWNWKNSENKINRRLAKDLANKALNISKDFGLRNIAIDVINGRNDIYKELGQSVNDIIEDRKRFEEILGGTIHDLTEVDYQNISKSDKAIYGISNKNQIILTRLNDFRSKSNNLYVELVRKHDSIEHSKVADNIIENYNQLLDYLKLLGKTDKEFVVSYESLINTNILLEALSYKEFEQPMGFSELYGIPLDSILKISHNLLEFTSTHQINYGYLGSSIESKTLNNSNRLGQRVGYTTQILDVNGSDRIKIDSAFKKYKNWYNDYKIILYGQQPEYLNGILESYKFDKNLMLDSYMRLAKEIFYFNTKNGQQLSDEDYMLFTELLNILGMHELKNYVSGTQENLKEYSNFLSNSNNEKLKSLVKLEM